MIYWQSSDPVQNVQDAVTSGTVTGWDVFAAIAILVIAWPVGIVARKVTLRALKRIPNLPEEVAADGARITRRLVFLVALAWALNILGVGVGWLTIIVVVVLVFGVLMLRPMVENAAAALLLTIRPVYDVGDQIESLGYEGTVMQIASRSTVLKAPDGREIHIPNTEVLSKPIVVYTATESRKASFDITVAFETDLDTTIDLLTKAVAGVDGILTNPAPSVQASAIHNNTITLSVGYWYPSSESSGSNATDGAIQAVTKAIVDAGVALARPTLDVDQKAAAPSGTSSQKPPSSAAANPTSPEADASKDSDSS